MNANMASRQYWSKMARKIAMPVLTALHNREFYRVFQRKSTARLEAFARILNGLAPWFEHLGSGEIVFLAQSAIDAMTDPLSPDYISFARPDQALVEAALFAQALLRAPNVLWHPLPIRVKQNIVIALKSARSIKPHDNNWLLFPSMIETFLLSVQEHYDQKRLIEGVHAFEKWYVGDGHYSDGDEFHFDYYNSLIIHPMLIDILETLQLHELNTFLQKQHVRLQRLATIQERMIAPDGTFPPIGRSLTYRCGVFHALALCALKDTLCIPAAQARVALTRVIKATLEHPDTFIEDGQWLTIGLYGKQELLAEPYINHGSVYMCCVVFLPLGLPSTHKFWTDTDVPTTWEQIMQGNTINRDKPLTECVRKHGRVV